MSGNIKKKIAFNYFGGKFTFVDQLIKYFPKHVHFVDVFGGSGSVILNKKPSEIDTYNDINSDVVNFFKVLRNRPEELIANLLLTPVSREEYNCCYYSQDQIIDELEKARAFYVRVKQSFYGLGAQRQNKGWHAVKTISRSKKPETISKWQNAIDKLDPVFERFLNIQIEHKSFDEIIPVMDFKDAFFYCDPPYPADCRSSSKDYKYDFRDEQHVQLAELLHSIKGKAMVSSYSDSKLTNELYKNWYKIDFKSKLNNIRSKTVQECIFLNYNPEQLNNYQLGISYDKL